MSLLIKFIKTIKIVKESQKYSIQSKAKQLSNCPQKTVSTNVSAFYRIKFPQNVGDHKKSWEKTRFTKYLTMWTFPQNVEDHKKSWDQEWFQVHYIPTQKQKQLLSSKRKQRGK